MTLQEFEAADGARLTYRDQGAGQPILALAGLTRDSRDFDYLARHLVDCRLVRLDSRGRGGSEWTGPATYTVEQEARDALALLDHLQISRAAIIGSSRGGLLGMVLAATAHPRVAGLCLNDVGPVIEREGLLRIAEYVGVPPSAETLADIADRLPLRSPGFVHVPPERWADEAIRHFTEGPNGVGITYDPALRIALKSALAAPPADLWSLFDACVGLPLALIRGANSDVLSRRTAEEMQRRRPDMISVEIADRGHTPFLDEPEALRAIQSWLVRTDAIQRE